MTIDIATLPANEATELLFTAILQRLDSLDTRLAELEKLAIKGNELMKQAGPMLEGMKGNPLFRMLGGGK